MQTFVAVARPSGLRSESAGLATSPSHFMVGRGMHPSPMEEGEGGTDAPSARRPVGSATTTDACVRRRRAFYRRAAIVRSPAVPPSISGTAASHQLQPRCVFAPLRLCVMGRRANFLRLFQDSICVICVICGQILAGGGLCASAFFLLCLCVSVSLWFSSCSLPVVVVVVRATGTSAWICVICGFSGGISGRNPNSSFRS